MERVTAAVAMLVLLVGLAGGREGPRVPYRPPYDTSCPAWTQRDRGFGDTRAEHREHAFLCLVRDASGPMFPAAMSDAELLAHGRRLCALPRWRLIDDWLRSEDRTINLRGWRARSSSCAPASSGAMSFPTSRK